MLVLLTSVIKNTARLYRREPLPQVRKTALTRQTRIAPEAEPARQA
jgi:hypothetical protein